MIRGFFSSNGSGDYYTGDFWAGDFMRGDTGTLTAVPAEGCTFVNWTENNTVVSTEATYSFEISEDRKLVANFTRPHTINVTVDPITGGSVTGYGVHYYGDTCALTASPMTEDGYQFYCWTENGEIVSTDSVYSFVVTENRDIIAHFGFPLNVTVLSVPVEGGYVTGAGTYNYGEICSVIASANDGYQFKYWTANGTWASDNPVYSFIVTSDVLLKAYFSLPSSTVIAIANPAQGGTISGNSEKSIITYDDGVCRGAWGISSCYWGSMFPAQSLRDYAGKFLTAVQFHVGGAHSGRILIYQGGDESPSVLVSQENYVCNNNWSSIEIPLVNPIAIDTTENLWIILNNYDGEFPAAHSKYTGDPNGSWYRFENSEEWEFREGSFMVRGVIEGGITNRNGRYWGGEFENGQTCTLTAVPNEGCVFVNWTEDSVVVSTESVYSFNVAENKSLSANFVFPCLISITSNPSDGGVITGEGVYMYGDSCTLTAMANEGYSFAYWTENDEIVSTDSVFSFVVTSERNLVANYTTPFTIITSVNTEGLGTVAGAGRYGYGELCTLTTIPHEGYVFHKWVEDGEVVSCDSEYTFAVTGDRNIVAYFAPEGSLCNIVFDMQWDYWTTLGMTVDYGDSTTEHLSAIGHDGVISFVRPVSDSSHISLSEALGQNFLLYIHYVDECPFYCSFDHYGFGYVNACFQYEFDVECEGGNSGHSVVVECDGYMWHGDYYSTSGTYTYEYTNIEGCPPSVDTLYLTINHPVAELVEAIACGSYTWNDSVYTQSGEYMRTFIAANGCDSVVTLQLTVNHPTYGDTTVVACDSYIWYDSTYTSSGTYQSYLTNAAGCDSVVTLYLTINHPVTEQVEATECDSYTWNGTTYTESGDYPLTLTTIAGCDSVVTLHLTLFENEASEFTITTNDSCYTWNDVDYCESGDFTQTLETVHGCDSVVTLHLTIDVGIDDYNGFNFKVYPNPTSNIVNVDFGMDNGELGDVKIQLYDVFGKLLDVTNVVGANNHSLLQTAQIDLSRYANGVYILKAVADGKNLGVRKVVRQ